MLGQGWPCTILVLVALIVLSIAVEFLDPSVQFKNEEMPMVKELTLIKRSVKTVSEFFLAVGTGVVSTVLSA